MSSSITDAYRAVEEAMNQLTNESLKPPGVKRETIQTAIIAWMTFSNLVDILDAKITFKTPKIKRRH